MRGAWNPCRDNIWDGEIGDRLIMMTSLGSRALSVLGQQQPDGSVDGYEFPFQGGACSSHTPVVFFAAPANWGSLSVDELFSSFLRNVDRNVSEVRVKSYGMVLAAVTSSRSCCAPPASVSRRGCGRCCAS